MSRADKVSDATGLEKIILTLRYHEQSRQWFAVVFVLLVSFHCRCWRYGTYVGLWICNEK